MYNRYIPQPDGSYRRSRIQEPSHPQPKQRPQPQPAPPVCPPPEPVNCKPEPFCREPDPIPPARPNPGHRDKTPGGFLRQLLPKDFDTGDLIVVLLLLLMAGDCEEDRGNAILTLALYFLM